MASSRSGLRVGIQILLALVIVALTYWLYVSVTEPYAVIERQQALRDQTRQRMDYVRQALIRYENVEDGYPSSLDSLVIFVRQDSFMQANWDSLFDVSITPESLLVSPRSGSRFTYAVNDTGRVNIYLLGDPDSEDHIGSEIPDVTRINAASWE